MYYYYAWSILLVTLVGGLFISDKLHLKEAIFLITLPVLFPIWAIFLFVWLENEVD